MFQAGALPGTSYMHILGTDLKLAGSIIVDYSYSAYYAKLDTYCSKGTMETLQGVTCMLMNTYYIHVYM